MIRRLSVKGVTRSHPIAIVKPGDFECQVSGKIDPLDLLRDPSYSLYCFDPENDSALFVRVDDSQLLHAAAFYYQAQAEHAVEVAEMPMTLFHQIAGEIPDPPRGVVFIHSVGRCGSTLVSKAFGAVPSVHSLSEPDDLTQLVLLRISQQLSPANVAKLLASSIKWRCKPRSGQVYEQVAIKMRSEVLVLAHDFGSLFRSSKHLFLYRDGIAWMRTLFRGFPESRDVDDEALNRETEESWSQMIPLVGELRRVEKAMNPVQVRMLAWITCMEGYLSLRDMGVPACAARFEDLVSSPSKALDKIFEFCGTGRVDWDAVERVLSVDSQAGTIYDREERRKLSRELTPGLVQDILDLVASRPQLRAPDVMVPGTLSI